MKQRGIRVSGAPLDLTSKRWEPEVSRSRVSTSGKQVVLGGKHSHRAPASSSIPTVFREGIQGMVLDAPVPWGKHFGLGVSSWSLGDLLLVSSGSLRRRGHCEARGLGEKREGREQSLFALDSGA